MDIYSLIYKWLRKEDKNMTNYYTLTPYRNHSIEDWGGVISDDFKSFARKWRNFVKRMCKENNWELCWFNVGHYYCSWMVKDGEKIVYCSFGDVRYFSKEWHTSILYRTAKHERDYTGGSNWYSDLMNLEMNIRKMFARGY